MKYYLLLSFSLFCFGVMAQTGSIKGVVNDEKLGRPIFGAKVFIEGTLYGSMTNMNGAYEIKNIKPGTYNVTCFYLLYGNKVVEDVLVNADETTELDIEMGQVAKQVSGTTVVIKKEKTTEAAAIDEVKEETKVVEVVSAQEISKKGDSKASDAVKRISGVSLVGGKYVYVRGLSDRYSKTRVNGSEIPALDPDRNSVQLDLFPSTFIGSIKVIKSFSPDLPGDFTGGLVDIRLREYPDSFFVRVGGNLGYNDQGSLNDEFLIGQRSSTDWLGVDDGSRDWPAAGRDAIEDGTYPVDAAQWLPRQNNPANPEVADQTIKSLSPEMAPSNRNSFLDHTFNIITGNKYKIPLKKDSLKYRTVGFFAGINYKREYDYYEGQQERWRILGNVDDAESLTSTTRYDFRQGRDQSLLGAYVHGTYKFNDDHKINLNLLHNQGSENRGRYGYGTNNQITGGNERAFLIQYTERIMSTGQLKGYHTLDSVFAKTPLKIDWIGAFTKSGQYQPDLRQWNDAELTNSEGETYYTFDFGAGAKPRRFQREMTEITSDFKLNLTAPFKIGQEKERELKIQAGASYLLKEREYRELRLDYINSIEGTYYNTTNPDLNEWLAGNNVGIINEDPREYGLINANTTADLNSYDGYQTITGVYGMAEAQLSDKITLIGGARMETTNIEVESLEESQPKGIIETSDVLPSINGIYKLMDKRVPSKIDTNKTNKRIMQVRASYNRTLARPTFKEIAPFAYEDPTQLVQYVGNPDLERSLIDNYDLRWEYYPRTGEQLTVALFYKYLQDPIEMIQDPRNVNVVFTWRNFESAQLYGLEIEFRKSLDVIARGLRNFSFGTNITLSQSQLVIPEDQYQPILERDPYRPETRPMFGQSPYLINALIEYDNDSLGFSANVTYNGFGQRLFAQGINGNPDIYEEARGRLDLNLAKRFFDERLNVTFRIQNILNPYVNFQYKYVGDSDVYDKFEGDYPFIKFREGRQYKIGFSYIF